MPTPSLAAAPGGAHSAPRPSPTNPTAPVDPETSAAAKGGVRRCKGQVISRQLQSTSLVDAVRRQAILDFSSNRAGVSSPLMEAPEEAA